MHTYSNMSKYVSFLTPGETCRDNLDQFEEPRTYIPDRQDGESDSTFATETPWVFSDDTVTEPSLTSAYQNQAYVTEVSVKATNVKSVKLRYLSEGEETEKYIENDEGQPKVIDLFSFPLLLKGKRYPFNNCDPA